MGAQPRYMIEHNGKTMTVYQYAKEVGIDRNTLQYRLKKGQPLIKPRDERKQRELSPRDIQRFGYPDGYTYAEITELYSNFAGQSDELQMLMDFTGLGHNKAERLLQKLKYERRKAV